MNINYIFSAKPENSGSRICFFLLLSIWGILFFIPEKAILIISIVIFFGFIYFIYYLASEGYLVKIIAGVIASIVIMVIAAAIPVIGWAILFFWVMYNLIQAFDGIRNLLPEACLSAVLYASLLIPIFSSLDSPYISGAVLSILCAASYIFSALWLCSRIGQRSDTPKNSLFLLSISLLSIPIIVLLLVSVITSLRAAFQTTLTGAVTKVPQSVSGYVTARGTVVEDYTRTITQTAIKSTITPGVGAIGASLTGSMGTLVGLDGKISERIAVHENESYATCKRHNFYRYDDLNDKKVENFINSFNSRKKFPALKKENIIFYFDETLLGKGDRGVVLTNDYVYCLLGAFSDEKELCIKFDDIAGVGISGVLNKEITLRLVNGKQYIIPLTQSNSGAEKIHKLIGCASRV